MTASTGHDKTAFQSRRFFENERATMPTPKPKLSVRVRTKLKRVRITVGQGLARNKKKLIPAALVAVVLLVGGAVYAFYQYQQSQNPAVIYAHKLRTMTDMVSKSVSIPKDEAPTVATVTDVTKLPNEAFFQQAQDGDKIIMYKKHKLAILYRPGTGKVITTASLIFQDTVPPQNVPVTISVQAVAGASTAASVTPSQTPQQQSSRPSGYHPDGKILVQPQQ